jgi:hypothetical protein
MKNQNVAKEEKGNAILPLVTCYCMICGKEFLGEEPKMCCSGRDCGCMGLPIEPVVCSENCYNKLISCNSKT